MGAEFRVIHIDPHGSGMDYSGHKGKTVSDAVRCCANCVVIFGTVRGSTEAIGFIPGELEPLNDEARAIQAQIDAEEAQASEYRGADHSEGQGT